MSSFSTNFKENFSNLIKKFNDNKEALQNNHPHISQLITEAIGELPYPANRVALFIWDNTEGSETKKTEDLIKYFEVIQTQEEDRFKEVIDKFHDLILQVKKIKDESAKQETIETMLSLVRTHQQENQDMLSKIVTMLEKIIARMEEEKPKDGDDSEPLEDAIYKSLTAIDYKRLGLSEYPKNNFILTEMKLDDVKSSWDLSDEDVVKREDLAEIEFNKILELESPIIIGATYGNGKTTTMKFFNDQYLKKWNEDRKNNYLPLFIPLKSKDEYRVNYEKYEKFIEQNNKNFNILLILDGLDEYSGNVEDLITETERLLGKSYGKLKVVITTRLDTNLPVKWPWLKKYVRLLPFSHESVAKFFKNDDITFEQLESIGLKYDEITKPLFCKMMQELKRYIKEAIGSGTKIKRVFLYREFIYRRLFLRENPEDINIDEQIQEKQTLRKIAALKTIFPNLTVEDILSESSNNNENKLSIFNENVSLHSFNNENIVKNILTTYFFHPHDGSNQIRMIDFLHKSFREYLLAEYYVESIVLGKIENLCIGKPSIETINFMIELLESIKNDDGDDLSKFLETIQIDSNDLINNNQRKQLIQNMLIKNSRIFTESDQSVFFTAEKIEQFQWYKNNLNINSLESIWMYRWISLVVQSTLDDNNGIYDQNLSDLIFLSSTFPHPAMKDFHGVNLSDTNLHNANLSSANLSKANLSDANLSNANLSSADLSSADLSSTDLRNTNLPNADLTNANLSKAHLSDANLSDANLSGADLSDADLRVADLRNAIMNKANLSDANLSDANLRNSKLNSANLRNITLSSANLSDAKLSDANLSKADLSNANLSKADLRNANLSDADLINAKLGKSNFGDADLSGADLSDANLIDADLSDVNLSKADLSDVNLSKADLIDANLSKANLSKANLIDADLSKAHLSDANLSDADLHNANLSDTDLRAANLNNANLSDVDLSDTDLRAANLRKADLSNANLSDANLSKAHLSDADLHNANLSDADLHNANLSDANLSDANLSNADLNNANLNNANLNNANLINTGLSKIQFNMIPKTNDVKLSSSHLPKNEFQKETVSALKRMSSNLRKIILDDNSEYSEWYNSKNED